MKNISIILPFIAFLFTAGVYPQRPCLGQPNTQNCQEFNLTPETLHYDIFYKKIKIGSSILRFAGEKQLRGKDVLFFTLQTKTPGFKDVEYIYADKKSILPIEIHREIRQIGTPTVRIKEIYDQKTGRIEIIKKGLILSKETTLTKTPPIHNPILLSYYFRRLNQKYYSQPFTINLPLITLKVEYAGIKEVKFRKEKYKAYVFNSIPKDKFILWLSTDKNKTPLRIENPGIFGYILLLNKNAS